MTLNVFAVERSAVFANIKFLIIITDKTMISPITFGHKLYWRCGLFGVLIGFAELSYVKNLHYLDQKKQEMIDQLAELKKIKDIE